MDPSKIFVGVPTRGQPRSSVVMALQALRDRTPGLPPIQYVESRLSVCDGRNKMAGMFRESKCDFLITIDDDIVPHGDILRIAERGLDVVAAPVLIVRSEATVPFPNVYDWNERQQGFDPVADTFLHIDRGTLLKCGGAGTGIMGISRRVFEHPQMAVPFQHAWFDNGQISMTEDLTFCRRATAAGFEVWADYSVFSDQIVNVNITWIANLYAEAMRKAANPGPRMVGSLYAP